MTCDNPEKPDNGGVTVSGNDIGSTATYTCNTGYELKGDDEATCTEADDGNSASFKPNPPVCKGKLSSRIWPAVIQNMLRNFYVVLCYFVNIYKKTHPVLRIINRNIMVAKKLGEKPCLYSFNDLHLAPLVWLKYYRWC